MPPESKERFNHQGTKAPRCHKENHPVDEVQALRDTLADRLRHIQGQIRQAQAQLDLLPGLAARRDADARLPDLAAAQRQINALLQRTSAQLRDTDPILRSTEELLGAGLRE